ncbi:MAG: hypothetical protein WAM91_05590 [Candidatus Acidiferrales bacterium]
MRATEHPENPADPNESPFPSTSVGIDRDELWKGFRRSERVRLEMSVDVYIIENDETIFEQATTLNVSAHGGLLILNTPVKLGQRVRLINPQANKRIEGHVNRVIMRHPAGGVQVGIEFVVMSPDFWDIPSPPADWDPNWAPAPERKRPPTPPWELQEHVAEVLYRESIQEVIREQKESVAVAPPAAKPNGVRVSKSLVLLAVSAAFFTLWTVEARRSSVAGLAVSERFSPVGVLPEDARLIPGINRSRIATADDFDSDAVTWLRGLGRQISGKIPGVFFGSFESNAYVLVGKANERRVVILAGGELRYNAEYPVVAIAARVPKELIQKISWADPSPPESDGDGLLIVRAADAPASSVVLFLRGTQVVSANPSDYRQVFTGQHP